jgi:ubiquinone/menaquinone biosynthesis C-methylase UbiE
MCISRFNLLAALGRTPVALIVLLIATHLAGQEKPAEKLPPPLTEYKGRMIAQTMHYANGGAEWLVRQEREREERCTLMFAKLGVTPGMKVCDMGCGNGYHTVKLAKAVGDEGRVYAVDIQPEMLELLKVKMKKAKAENYTPVLSNTVDPKLPKGEIDLILLVDVYHEFSNPEEMLARMKESLAPKGAIVLVEYRAEDPKVPIKPEHKMSKDQINKELTANGFKLSQEFDKLPWQHMMWFTAADE